MNALVVLKKFEPLIDDFEEGKIDRFAFEQGLVNVVNEILTNNTVTVESKCLIEKKSILKMVSDEQYDAMIENAVASLFQRLLYKLKSKNFIKIKKYEVGYKQQLRISLTVKKPLEYDD